MNLVTLILIMIVPELIALFFIIWYLRLHLIFAARRAGVQIPPIILIGMRLRKVNPDLIVLNGLKILQSGIELSPENREELFQILEAHHLAGGNVGRVAAALAEAQKRGEQLSLQEACAIDLELVGHANN